MIHDRNIALNANINPAKIAGGGGISPLLYLASLKRQTSRIAPNVFYVDPDFGKDGNSGLTPDYPFKTVLKARTVQAAKINWTLSPWAINDAIILFPGIYDEINLTGGLYGVHVIGLGNGDDINGESGAVIKPATGVVWDANSWINMTFSNIALLAAATAVPVMQLDTFNRGIIQDCVFQGIPGSSDITTIGFEIVVDMTGSIWRRNLVNQCLTGISLGITAPKQITGNRFEDFDIMGAETAGIQLDADCVAFGTVFKRFTIGPTPALGVDDNASAATYYAMFIDGRMEATACDPASASGHYSGCYLNGGLMA